MPMLIVYAVLAALALGGTFYAWTGFKDRIGKPYADAQRAADQKVVDKANRDAAESKQEAENARADAALCEASSKKQTEAIATYKQMAERNANAAREAKAKAEREATANAPKIADLQAKAAAAPKLMACEEELSKAKEVLRDTLRARRAVPPAGAPK